MFNSIMQIRCFLAYCSVKARDAINRRLYNNQPSVETAIYRVFVERGLVCLVPSLRLGMPNVGAAASRLTAEPQ
ncbi:hypothetical protein [Nostoc sp.]|uniref:hypothetical protein n=1 Tax=Nostoc sp. TaxID=1180 RepID=UPI002FFC8B3F